MNIVFVLEPVFPLKHDRKLKFEQPQLGNYK